MNEKKITLKGFKKTISAKDGDKKYIVTFDSKEGEEIKFLKNDKKEKSTNKITVKMREEKQKEEEAVPHEVELTNDTGYFLRNVKLPKTIGDVEMKEEVSLPVKGYEIGFWVGLGVIVVILLGLGYWWFSSSRKEDKEEEGL